jgi:hypothetical protein
MILKFKKNKINKLNKSKTKKVSTKEKIIKKRMLKLTRTWMMDNFKEENL